MAGHSPDPACPVLVQFVSYLWGHQQGIAPLWDEEALCNSANGLKLCRNWIWLKVLSYPNRILERLFANLGHSHSFSRCPQSTSATRTVETFTLYEKMGMWPKCWGGKKKKGERETLTDPSVWDSFAPLILILDTSLQHCPSCASRCPSHREAKDPTRQDIFLYLCCLLSSVTTTWHHTIPTAPLHGSLFFSTVCVYSLPGLRWSAPPSLLLCWKPAAAMTKRSYRCKNSACVQLNLITSSYLSANPHRILTRAFKTAAAVVNATSFFQVPSGETPPNSSPDSSDVA